MEQQDKPTEGLTVTDDNKGQIQETSKPDYSYEEKTECPFYLKVSFLVVFFMTGITNHLGTVLILTGSRNLCVELGKENFMGFYTIATIICSSVTRIVNSRVFIRVSYQKRIFFLSFYLFSAYILLFLTLHFNQQDTEHKYTNLFFVLSLLSSFIMGTGYAFGESTMLGYLKLYPKFLVGGWSSGTGMASLTGAILNLIARYKKSQSQGFDLKYIYLFVSPICLCYILFFLAASKLKETYDRLQKTHPGLKQFVHKDRPIEPASATEGLQTTEEQVEEQTQEEIAQKALEKNKPLSIANLKQAYIYAFRLITNLGAVYFFEFTTLNGLVERVTRAGIVKADNPIFTYYEALVICYQIGAFIARSALPLVKHVTIVEIFTIFQATNLVFWILEYYLEITHIYGILAVTLVVLGFVAGGSYAACFYFMLNDPREEFEPYKELAVNMTTISNDLGTLGSGLMVLLLHNFIMKI